MIVSMLYRGKLSLISTLPLAVLVTYGLPNALELTVYYTLGGYFGVLALGRAQRFSSFIRAGLAITLSGIVIIVAFRLPQTSTDWFGLATLASAALVCSIAAAGISLMLDYFLAQLLGMTTALQLTELSRPDHPLMQFILRNAPGTYQHSLQLANLAEQAAELINADPLLTRVGALYHDCGKAINPVFFIENQLPGSPNPHEDLSPVASAEIILRHVTDGVEMGRRYHLPRRILDFIKEHHGTMITHYQYVMAVEAANGDESLVDINTFRYPGPRPRSRETALLMLADGSEAACVLNARHRRGGPPAYPGSCPVSPGNGTAQRYRLDFTRSGIDRHRVYHHTTGCIPPTPSISKAFSTGQPAKSPSPGGER
jgi:putative nucleotidyltransferase with HDIG domain